MPNPKDYTASGTFEETSCPSSRNSIVTFNWPLVKVPVNKVLDTDHTRTGKINQLIIIVRDIVPCQEDFWAWAQQLHIFVHKVYV